MENNNDNVITMGSGTGKTNHDPKIEKLQKAIDNPEIPDHILSSMIDNEFPVIEDVVDLPSKGIFYPNKQSQVKVKQLTTEDENILLSPELIRSGKVLDVLLDNAIIDGQLSSEDMLVGDRNAVLLYLRKEGYGDEYPVKMNCPSCGETFEETILISELKYKELSTMPDSEGYYTVTLPKSKWVVKFRLLNGKDENYLQKMSEKMKKTKQNVSYSPLLTERYVLQIMSINGKTDKLDVKKGVERMPIADSFFLREYMNVVAPGVDMEHNYTCKHCQHKFEDGIQINARLFWPNAKV